MYLFGSVCPWAMSCMHLSVRDFVLLLRPQAQERIEVYVEERTSQLKQKIANLQGVLSKLEAEHHQEIIKLKKQVHERVASVQLKLEEVTRKKKEVRRTSLCGELPCLTY